MPELFAPDLHCILPSRGTLLFPHSIPANKLRERRASACGMDIHPLRPATITLHTHCSSLSGIERASLESERDPRQPRGTASALRPRGSSMLDCSERGLPSSRQHEARRDVANCEGASQSFKALRATRRRLSSLFSPVSLKRYISSHIRACRVSFSCLRTVPSPSRPCVRNDQHPRRLPTDPTFHLYRVRPHPDIGTALSMLQAAGQGTQGSKAGGEVGSVPQSEHTSTSNRSNFSVLTFCSSFSLSFVYLARFGMSHRKYEHPRYVYTHPSISLAASSTPR